MLTQKSDAIAIRGELDVVATRQIVRAWTSEQGFGIVDQTKMVTAASELARNVLVHGGGGSAKIFALVDGTRKGVRVIFEDSGPGIPNVELALKDGYTTKGGMGLGLGGARRLVNEFEISSEVGKGTRVVIARWKS